MVRFTLKEWHGSFYFSMKQLTGDKSNYNSLYARYFASCAINDNLNYCHLLKNKLHIRHRCAQNVCLSRVLFHVVRSSFLLKLHPYVYCNIFSNPNMKANMLLKVVCLKDLITRLCAG